jgi:membrane protease YdiL (CAAX protease family)
MQSQSPNWRNLGLFLGLTFILTWILNLVLWQTIDSSGVNAVQLLQLQMLLPAFCAILLSMFIFKDSPIYYKAFHQRSRLFFYFYLAFTFVYALMSALAMAIPDQAATISAISGGINILGLVILVLIRIISGKKALDAAGLSFGSWRQWLIWGLAFTLFYALQAALNAVFNLGEPVDPTVLLAGMAGAEIAGMSALTLRVLLFFQTALIGPFLGLLFGFGEEYGWRGYLQSELIKLGKVRGVLLLGLIWGIWHYPAIWLGHNYPGQPVWGTVIMTGYTILLGFVLSHVMLKTGSIWLVAFLHALNNQVLAYIAIAFYQVDQPHFAFGIGLLGLVSMLPIVLLLLRDPIWRDQYPSVIE